MRFSFIALLLVAISAVSLADVPRTCNLGEDWEGGVGISWSELSFTAILTVLLFVSLAYMGGVMSSKPEWVLWAKEEIFQVMISVILVLAVGGFATAVCEISSSLNDGQNPLDSANSYLVSLAWGRITTLATLQLGTKTTLSMLAASPIVIGFDMGMTIRPFAGLSAIEGLIDKMYTITSGLFATVVTQLLILNIAAAVMFKFVLPMGVFMRIFPFLRKAAATMIAVAIGFYVVFPLLYVMNSVIMTSMESGHQERLYGVIEPQNMGAYFVNWATSPGIEVLILGTAYLTGGLSLVLMAYVQLMVAVVAQYVWDMSQIFIYAIFLPTLNFMILMAFINNLKNGLSKSIIGGG